MGRISDYERLTKRQLEHMITTLRSELSEFDGVELPSPQETKLSDPDTLKTLIILCECNLLMQNYEKRDTITKIFKNVGQNSKLYK